MNYFAYTKIRNSFAFTFTYFMLIRSQSLMPEWSTKQLRKTTPKTNPKTEHTRTSILDSTMNVNYIKFPNTRQQLFSCAKWNMTQRYFRHKLYLQRFYGRINWKNFQYLRNWDAGEEIVFWSEVNSTAKSRSKLAILTTFTQQNDFITQMTTQCNKSLRVVVVVVAFNAMFLIVSSSFHTQMNNLSFAMTESTWYNIVIIDQASRNG